MDQATSDKAFVEVFEYFQYVRKPSDIQLNQWYEKIKFIPPDSVDWIVGQITDNDKMPRNLPKAFVAQWYAYRKVHKEKAIAEQYEFCEDCYGHGTHLFKKLSYDYDPPKWISYVARCSMCRNWKKQFGNLAETGGTGSGKYFGPYTPPIVAMTKQEILDKGFIYLGQRDAREKKITVKKKNVEQLAAGMLNEMPKAPKKYEGPRNESN